MGIEAPLFRKVDLEQGSDEWHAWRADGIGSSDASIILGQSIFCNPDELRAKKRSTKSASQDQYMSPAAAEGIMLEAQARKSFERRNELTLNPACLENVARPWMRCSVDGICFGSSALLEIKCGLSNYNGVLKYGRIPPWYFAQLQHILAVTGYSEINFFSYRPLKKTLNIVCPRDETFISELIEIEQRFWDSI